MRRRGAEGQRPGGAEDPAPVPQPGGHPAHQALQRFWRRRRVRGHRRAGRRSGDRSGRRAARSTMVWTARSWPFPNLRSGWPWWWPRRTRQTFIAAAEAENLEAYSGGRGHGKPPDGHGVERHRHCRPLPRVPEHQRRCEARGGTRGSERPRPLWKKRGSTSLREMAGSLKSASRRGLTERFDSYHRRRLHADALRRKTPAHACSGHGCGVPRAARRRNRSGQLVMAWGCDPEQTCSRPLYRCIQRRVIPPWQSWLLPALIIGKPT